MHAFEFLRPVAKNKPERKPIYAISGDDAYLRDESIRAIVRLAVGGADAEMAVSKLPGERARLADVLDEVRTLPFLAKCRVVVVENADPFVTAHRKELEAYAEKPSTSGVLVLSVKSWPGSTKLAKLVEKVGLAVDCKSPDERDLPAWLVQLAKGRGVKLDDDAARLMVELVGPEVGLLAAEVDKLAVFVGDRQHVARADVARMVGSGRVETIWSIIDAATTGRGAEALADLDHLLASGEAPQAVMGAIASNLRKVHHAGQLRLARVDLRSACQAAGITYSAAIEKAGKQHAHLGPGRVAALPALLLAADLDLKGGKAGLPLPPKVVLEALIAELARPRRD